MINVVARVIASEYWEIIADNLSKAGLSWGVVSAIDSSGRTIWIADAHRGDEKRCLEKERERQCHPGRSRSHEKGAVLPPEKQPRFVNRNATDKRSYASAAFVD